MQYLLLTPQIKIVRRRIQFYFYATFCKPLTFILISLIYIYLFSLLFPLSSSIFRYTSFVCLAASPRLASRRVGPLVRTSTIIMVTIHPADLCTRLFFLYYTIFFFVLKRNIGFYDTVFSQADCCDAMRCQRKGIYMRVNSTPSSSFSSSSSPTPVSYSLAAAIAFLSTLFFLIRCVLFL